MRYLEENAAGATVALGAAELEVIGAAFPEGGVTAERVRDVAR